MPRAARIIASDVLLLSAVCDWGAEADPTLGQARDFPRDFPQDIHPSVWGQFGGGGVRVDSKARRGMEGH